MGAGLKAGINGGVFYLPSSLQTDASRAITRRIDDEKRRGRNVVSADTTESSVYPLSWYAQQIYSSDATVVHLAAHRHRGSEIHNARAALIAGLARGMGKSLLILSEDDQLAPIDYRDLVVTYSSTKQLGAALDEWLRKNLLDFQSPPESTTRARHLELRTELRSIDLGEPVAENEAFDLERYFLETASFNQVLSKATTVFVGRKGAGKSANLIRASDVLSADKRNLVCVIQPSSYELEAVVQVLTAVSEAKSYVTEALWQYLLFTEIARTAAAALRARPAGPAPGTPEWELLDFVDDPANAINDEFAIRLERAVRGIQITESNANTEEIREKIGKALHADVIPKMRRILGDVLRDRERVCVLIDNLDKAWDKTADLDQLAVLLLGLLGAVRRIDASFKKNDSWRETVDVTLAVFLRSDIFDKVVRVAREPDKIPVSRLVWTDRRMLLRVVEERYRASHDDDVDGTELWTKYFPAEVKGQAFCDYMLYRVLPRPRDILQFCGFAINAAINAGHGSVDDEDIKVAEALYSQFAFEALLVENGLTVEQLEAVLIEFAGGEAILSRDWIDDAVRRAGLDEDLKDRVLTRLRQLSFFGVEVKDSEFRYGEDSRDDAKVDALARGLSDRRGAAARFEIHPAYRPYLEIED